MKKINEEELKELVKNGFTQIKITEIFNVSLSTIRRMYKKLGIVSINKIPKNEIVKCKECYTLFESSISDERKFCTKSCSVKFSNSRRKHSEETKSKIKETLEKSRPKKEKEKIIRKITRNCKNCENTIFLPKIICDECKINYYNYYRKATTFDFDVNQYKNRLDYDLVEKHGWYSPSNKGNNLNGVSKDHMYSVREGFINGVDPEIIKHPANCRLMIHNENNKKNTKCSITLEELLDRIDKW
jgi:hypothetical protein